MNQIDFTKYEVDTESRSIVFSCASDVPYLRYDEEKDLEYNEILVIDEAAVDLSRLNNGAAVLFNHETERLLGTVEKAWIVENKIYVKVRFSRNDEFADRIYKDILDGVIKNVSIGYQINHYTDRKENGVLNRYVDSFMIYECSIVSVPADTTVGIRQFKAKERQMEDEKKDEFQDVNLPEETEKETAVEDSEIETLKAENAELKKRLEDLEQAAEEPKEEIKECAETETKEDETVDGADNDKEEIEKLGEDFNVPKDEIKSAIESKMTVREFKHKVKNINFNIKGKKDMDAKREFSDFLKGRNYEKPFTLRDFTGFGGKTGEGGAPLIGTETYPLVAALQKVMGVKGFRTLNGLTSNVTIPVQSTRNTVYQTSDLRTAATTSNPAFTSKTLSPVKISGNTVIGKELLVQANDDVVAFIIDSLTREIGYKVEDYMLGKVVTGAGNTVTYSALSAIDWDDILAFESNVAAYSLDTAFVMSPSARAALKGIEKATNTAQFLCDADNRINGYACNVSGCVSNNNIYFGDWSKLILGVFGEGLEIIVNPYTYAKEGNVEIVANMCIDAVVEQGDAFVLGKVQAAAE